MTTPHAPEELQALTRFAFDEFRTATGGIGSFHRAVASRAQQPGLPKLMHDSIAGGVYGALGASALVAGRVAAAALPKRAVSDSGPGALVVGILNGLFGDTLEEQANPLSQGLSVRVAGRRVPVELQALAAAFPGASPRIVVFLHGLMGTEHAWRWGAQEPYGERLRAELGRTPVYIRHNSGRHISENGRALHHELERLVAAWPVPVADIALVGHSMGGLVARSAAHVGSQEEASWVRHVRHVVSLGTPHMGAPLENIVHKTGHALHRLPETQPLARFLRRRSAGIRDLRYGSLVDDDWRDQDPHALCAKACAEVPLLDGATHFFISATVTHTPHHPLGRLVGDMLVLQDSASGRSRSRRIPFEEEHGHHVGGATHMALLNHPQVYEQLRAWLSR